MEIVKIIPKADYATLESIAEEYLGQDLAELKTMYDKYPAAFAGYYIDNALVGCCYGQGGSDGYFTLNGIAIVYPYHAQGRGSKLLAFFENCVYKLGYIRIDLGSADGYVERFYLKNGYTPIALKILVEGDGWKEQQQGYAFPVAEVQTQGEYTKLVLTVRDYAAMNKNEITEHYGGVESFFVFEKNLT